ncbi:MAG TPA: hypothetical protein VGH04_02130 [Gemmatimonadaceae bacterium]
MAARTRGLALLLVAVVAACNSSATTGAALGGTDPTRPDPSAVGRLTVRVDTGLAIVGRHLQVQVSATDVSGVPIDASSTELTSTNPSVAQLLSAVAVPIGVPSTKFYDLSATFDLTAAGSTAIRARLGILSDSVVISVVPP